MDTTPFVAAPSWGLRHRALLASACAVHLLAARVAHAQSLAMQDISPWSSFQVPAPAPDTTGPLPSEVFSDARREGPWRVSDQYRVGADALQLMQLLRQAQWDDALHLLKQQQPDLNKADEEGNTPLSLAAASGQLALVREMLRQGAQLDQAGAMGLTPLVAAVWYGHEWVVRDLLRQGARLDAMSAQGQLPLHAAAAAGKTRIMALLVEAGADWRWPNRRGHHAVSEAAFFGQEAALQWLLAHGAPVATPDATRLNAVHAAALGGHVATVRWLQQRGVPVPSPLTQVLIEQAEAGPVALATP